MDGVVHLLENRGALPIYRSVESTGEISPRRRGVKQGGILILTGALLVPILGILSGFANSSFLEALTAVAAILCFLGGPVRMVYAALFEEGAPRQKYSMPPAFVPPPASVHSALPPQVGAALPAGRQTASSWRPRPTTGEIVRPPSVTENTTRLLDKDEPREH